MTDTLLKTISDYKRIIRIDDVEVNYMIMPLSLAAPFFDGLYDLLASDEKERYERIGPINNKTQFVTTRGILRVLLAEVIQCEATDIIFEYGTEGKPALCNAEHLQFNTSHSGDYLMIGISGTSHIGVDIQTYSKKDNLDKIAVSSFTSFEMNRYQERLKMGDDRAFFYTWVEKEARTKCLGQSIFIPVSQDLLPDLHSYTQKTSQYCYSICLRS